MEQTDLRSERLAAVEDLLRFAIPLEMSARRLMTFPWDYVGVGVSFHAGHVISVLQRVLDGTISVDQVEEWANMIECREDVDISGGPEGWTGRTLHELANPPLFGAFSCERAKVLLAEPGAVGGT